MPWIFMKKIRVKLYIVETTLAGKPDIYISLTLGLELEGAELIWYTFSPMILCSGIKVHLFWEGHKILQNLHLTFVLCSASQK